MPSGGCLTQQGGRLWGDHPHVVSNEDTRRIGAFPRAALIPDPRVTDAGPLGKTCLPGPQNMSAKRASDPQVQLSSSSGRLAHEGIRLAEEAGRLMPVS